MDINGDLLLNEELLNKGLYLNFLDYERLKYDISRLNIRNRANTNYGPHIPYVLFKMGYQQKGCSNIYRILTDPKHDIVEQTKAKWENVLNEEINNTRMETAFQHLHKMSEGSFDKYIQFKMLHRRIITNKKLLDMNIRNESKCPYCDEAIETTEHAFLKCPDVTTLWKDIERWLRAHVDAKVSISDIDNILGQGSTNSIKEKTITATKKVIYRNRQHGGKYNIKEVKNVLSRQKKIEEYQASVIGDDTIFLNTWEKVYVRLYLVVK